jgi:hypothetical protein
MLIAIEIVMNNTARNDIHRVSQIHPEDGWPVPSINVNCKLDGAESHHPSGCCCILGLFEAGVKFAEHGTTGKCTVCGTHFSYGDVWKHLPTGEHIHVGHQCADKYNLIADRREFELELGKARARSAREHEKAMKQEAREEFLKDYPGLQEALETDHHIVRDIKSRFEQWGSLSEKQVTLVMKLHKESLEPKEAETLVPAPIQQGRQVIQGTVVSVKSYDTAYGSSLKMTVKVRTPDGGTWLTWGTVPQALLGSGDLRGSEVRFTARLKSGRDAHFALFSRPVAC